jgi:hypothetical protein
VADLKIGHYGLSHLCVPSALSASLRYL